jgi:hypothetical protein
MSDEDTVRLRESIDALNKTLKGSNTGGGGGGGGGFSLTPFNSLKKGLNTAADGASTLGDALEKLGSGTATTKDALTNFNKALSDYGGAFGKILGDAGKKISDAVLTTNSNLNKASEYGATFGNNIAEFDSLIKGARMTQDEYTEMVKKGAAELGALGSTVNRAQKNFLEMNEQLHQRPIIAQLEKLGMSAELINKAMYVASMNQPGFNANDPLMRQRQIDATEKLIESIDENSRITGIGKKEQLEQLQQIKSDKRIQAMMRSLDPMQRQALDAILPQLSNASPAMKTVIVEQATGAIRTDEGTKAAATLGATGSLAEAVRVGNAIRNAKSPEDVANLKNLFDTAITKHVEGLEKKPVSTLGMIGGPAGSVPDRLGDEYVKTPGLQQLEAKMAEAHVGAGEALKLMQEEARKEAAGQKPTGEPITDPAVKLATTINEIDRNLKGAAGGLSSVFGELARDGGKVIEALNKNGQLDNLLRNRSQEGWKQELQGLKNAATNELNDIGKGIIPDSLRKRFDEGSKLKENESNNIRDPNDLTKPLGKEEPHIFASGTPEFEKFLSGGGGFKDMFTNFDPKGEPALLHGNEIVANEDQMMRFIEKMFPRDMFRQLSQQVSTSSSSKSGSMNFPLPTSFGTDIANQIKPMSTSNAADIERVFNRVNDQMEKVVLRLSEVTDKMKNISFIPATDKFNEQLMEIFKNIGLHVDGNIKESKSSIVNKADNSAEDKKKQQENANKEQAAIAERNKPEITYSREPEPATPTTEPAKSTLPATAPPTTTDTATIKTAENTPPPPAGTSKDAEAGLKDPRDEFTNAEMKELETGIQSTETIKRKVREGENKFFIDKIAELKGRNDEDAVHDLPIFEAQYAAFKPKYDAETAAAARQRELTLAAEKKQRDIEEGRIVEPKKTEKPPEEKAQIKTAEKDVLSTGLDFKEISTEKPEEKKESSLDKSFNNLSDKLTESVSTNVVKPEDNTEKLTNAMETFKSPDYSASFNSLGDKFAESATNKDVTAAKLQDESAKVSETLAPNQETPVPVENEQKLEANQPTESKGFFDKIGDMFKPDNSPLFTRGNVRYENVKQETPEENAAKLAAENTPEAIAARKADPNDPANIYREQIKNSGLYKHDDLWKSIVNEDKAKGQSAKSAEPAGVAKPAPHHIGGLESWQEFNARKDAESVKSSHAQIKDVTQNQVAPSTHELTTKPAPVHAPEPMHTEQQSNAKPASSQTSHTVSLKEIYDAVIQLNKTMSQMASHTESISSSSQKQVKATNNMSNRFY